MLRIGIILILASIVIFGVALATLDDDAEVLSDQNGGTSTTSVTTTTRPTPPLSATTTSTTVPEPANAVALITPNGVIVPVRAETSRGYHVFDNCGEPAFVTNGSPIARVDVVLDPGHGGEVDTGAVAPTGLIERDLNMAVATATLGELEERGIATLLTRSSSYTVPLSVRSAIADLAGAEILVSIHHNAPAPGVSESPGTEVFVQSENEDSRRLGGLLFEHMVDALGDVEGVTWHAAPDAGVLRVHNSRGLDTYGMIRLPETPSALIEIAYINSREEAEFMATSGYLPLVSVALADAIEAYLTSNDPGSGFIDEPRRFTAQPSIAGSVCEGLPLG